MLCGAHFIYVDEKDNARHTIFYRSMLSSTAVRAIYRCLLRDARELQCTPHSNIRRELQLEQWGTGGFVEPLVSHEETTNETDAVVLKSLQQFQRLRDDGFFVGPRSVDLTKSIQLAFRENLRLDDVKVSADRDGLWRGGGLLES